MQDLLDSVVDLVALVSPAKLRSIASALKGLPHAKAAPGASAFVDTAAARATVERLMMVWSQIPVSGDTVAGMILGATEARLRAEREQSVELVWTGPKTRLVPTRRTEQVLLDLIGNARSELFLVSFVAYDVASIVASANRAVDRGIRVRLLLESSTSHGGSLQVDPAATMHASIPAAEIFMWRDKPEPFVDGKVHAKVAVADGEVAFITSANLTGYALEKNMEAGVLIRGGTVPRILMDHLQGLADIGVIGRWSP